MKQFTDSNTIVTKMSVPREEQYSGKHFAEVSARWQQEPWVEYLYTHASIKHIDTYKEPIQYSTVYVMYWELDEKKKTFLLLKWSEKIDKVYI